MTNLKITNPYKHSYSTYEVNGWIMMKKNQDTFDMERKFFVTNITVFSRLKNIDTDEDIECFECEISRQINCDWFELDSFGIK
jgi:hypothetical protein